MNRTIWDEQAARLRSALDEVASASVGDSTESPEMRRGREQEAVSRFLRQEFSDFPPDDTSTLPLFPFK